MAAKLNISDRIRGGLMGALVGDALGVPVEFRNRSQLALDPVRGMRGFGTWNQPPGTWSDDGAMMMCTVEALARGGGASEVAAVFVRWMEEGYWAKRGVRFDIGGTTEDALCRVASGVPIDESGGRAESSNGNGSLMRILPVALRFGRAGDAELARQVMRIGGITHAHLRSQLACVLYTTFVEGLLRGLSVVRSHAEAVRRFAPLVERNPQELHAFGRLMSGDFRNVPASEIKASGYVIHTLEAALWCLHQADGFNDAVLRAVNLGEDTDTTGCVVGGAAGVAFGYEAIPREWTDAVMQECTGSPERELGQWIDRFADQCGCRP